MDTVGLLKEIEQLRSQVSALQAENEGLRKAADWISGWSVSESGETALLIKAPKKPAATIEPSSASDDSKHRVLRELLWLMSCDVMEANNRLDSLSGGDA